MNFDRADNKIISKNINGLNVDYIKNTGKPCLLLIPGAYQGTLYFFPLMQKLHENGFEPWSVDLVGHGKNPPFDLSDTHMWDYTKSLIPIVNTLKPACIIGHSMGGFLLQALCRELDSHPKIALIAPAPNKNIPIGFKHRFLISLTSFAGIFANWLGRKSSFERWLTLKLASNKIESKTFFELKKSIISQEQIKNKETPHLIHDIQSSDYSDIKPSDIKSPVLLIAGKKDLLIPYSAQKKLAKYFNASFVTLKKSGHIPFLEKDISKLVKKLSQFINL